MKPSKILARIAISSTAFAVLDSIWIGVVMKKFYNEQLGDLARRNDRGMSPDWIAVILVYVVLVAGVNIFAVDTGPRKGRMKRSLVKGGLFGLISYGIYDLTNKATLKGWSWEMTVVDMAWGMVLCAIVASVVAGVTE